MAKVPIPERYVVRLLPTGVGFYLLTYVSARDPRNPPKVWVTRKPGSTADVAFLFGPDVVNDLLMPGQAVAVACREATDLLITMCAAGVTATDDVELRFDKLGDRPLSAVAPKTAASGTRHAAHKQQARRGASRTRELPIEAPEQLIPGKGPLAQRDSARSTPVSGSAASEDESAAQSGSSHFALAGHIQVLGDTQAGPDGWLGAADGRRWIEGLSAAWQEGIPGLRLTYAVDSLGHGLSKTCLVGEYAGTRRQARPLVGVQFELSGAQAAAYELVVRAAFLGGIVQHGTGRRVELMGPTGEEPLTGLWLDVRRISTAPAAKGKAYPETPAAKSRLRVFRSKKL